MIRLMKKLNVVVLLVVLGGCFPHKEYGPKTYISYNESQNTKDFFIKEKFAVSDDFDIPKISNNGRKDLISEPIPPDYE